MAVIASAGIFLTTIQAQDFKDTEGDRLIGRKTLPIVVAEPMLLSFLSLGPVMIVVDGVENLLTRELEAFIALVNKFTATANRAPVEHKILILSREILGNGMKLGALNRSVSTAITSAQVQPDINRYVDHEVRMRQTMQRVARTAARTARTVVRTTSRASRMSSNERVDAQDGWREEVEEEGTSWGWRCPALLPPFLYLEICARTKSSPVSSRSNPLPCSVSSPAVGTRRR